MKNQKETFEVGDIICERARKAHSKNDGYFLLLRESGGHEKYEQYFVAYSLRFGNTIVFNFVDNTHFSYEKVS